MLDEAKRRNNLLIRASSTSSLQMVDGVRKLGATILVGHVEVLRLVVIIVVGGGRTTTTTISAKISILPSPGPSNATNATRSPSVNVVNNRVTAGRAKSRATADDDTSIKRRTFLYPLAAATYHGRQRGSYVPQPLDCRAG